MVLPHIIRQHFNDLTDLCERFGVEKLYAFGSVLTTRFNRKTSDLDLMVFMQTMPPIERGENLIALWDALEKLFGRKVDLLTDQPIKNPYLRKSVESTKQLIYDRISEKVPV
ncbi:MAG: nucleotidyltransferase domain-containing protein [Bacteroidetes bacterium]|nr:nucleotidyltransferase domain-containing protein [Bacteroidota bacterium]